MEKKNWYENVNENVPVKNKNRHPLSFDAFDIFNLPSLSDDDFGLMKGLDGIGFQDKGDHYEMTTDLGGQKGESGTPEDAVKVELTGKNNRTVEITYEHSTSTDENCFYSHSQKTSVTLPADADEETIKAYFDDNDNVVVSVKKKSKEPEKKGPRSIPVGVRHNDK